MKKLKQILQNLGPDDWVFGLTGILAAVISILDLVGWLQISTDTLIQLAVTGIGLLMAALVLHAGRQNTSLTRLAGEIDKSLKGRLEIIKFAKSELAFEHMARVMYSATSHVDHASLYTVPRWPHTMSDFEKAYEHIILSNQIKVRYLADLSDEVRQKRVRKYLSNPEVNRYFVSSIASKDLYIPVINFMIIDGEEVIFAIPGFGEQDALMSIKSKEIVEAFEQYFNLLWSKAHPTDRADFIELRHEQTGL